MAWIESHQELWRHPQDEKNLPGCWGCQFPTVVGHLHGIWYWALDFAQDGDLHQYDPRKSLMLLCGRRSGQFIEALVAAGYLDQTDDGLSLHDWYDYAGRLIEQREARREQDRARKQRQQERKKASAHEGHGEVTEESRGTPDDVTPLPYLTQPNQTEQDNTEATTPPSPLERGERRGEEVTRRAQV